MTDLSNTYRPNTLDGIQGSASKPGGIVDFLKLLIRQNLNGSVNKFLLSGPSGTGKTTLAMAYAKTTLCLNRTEGSDQACGECAVCTAEDPPNVYRYVITSPVQARDYVRALIEQSYLPPEVTTKDPSKFRQFIILEETQQASPELMAELLEPLEKAPEYTTWIIGTMNFAKLKQRDQPLADALQSRCKDLKLTAFTDVGIAQTLQQNIPDLTAATAKAIAKFAEGNMRLAYNNLAHFLYSKQSAEITPTDVYQHFLGGAGIGERKKFWQALQAGELAKSFKLLDKWLSNGAELKAIAQVLEEDLIKVALTHSQSQPLQNLLQDLGRWQASQAYDLRQVFISYSGINLKTNVQPQERQAGVVKLNQISKLQDLLGA